MFRRRGRGGCHLVQGQVGVNDQVGPCIGRQLVCRGVAVRVQGRAAPVGTGWARGGHRAAGGSCAETLDVAGAMPRACGEHHNSPALTRCHPAGSAHVRPAVHTRAVGRGIPDRIARHAAPPGGGTLRAQPASAPTLVICPFLLFFRKAFCCSIVTRRTRAPCDLTQTATVH